MADVTIEKLISYDKVQEIYTKIRVRYLELKGLLKDLEDIRDREEGLYPKKDKTTLGKKIDPPSQTTYQYRDVERNITLDELIGLREEGWKVDFCFDRNDDTYTIEIRRHITNLDYDKELEAYNSYINSVAQETLVDEHNAACSDAIKLIRDKYYDDCRPIDKELKKLNATMATICLYFDKGSELVDELGEDILQEYLLSSPEDTSHLQCGAS